MNEALVKGIATIIGLAFLGGFHYLLEQQQEEEWRHAEQARIQAEREFQMRLEAHRVQLEFDMKMRLEAHAASLKARAEFIRARGW
jgi:hypothetical protein